MIENEMGNRGSKSNFKLKFVKEQRIHGNQHKLIMFKVYSNRFWKIPFNQNPFINKFISFNNNLYYTKGISSISSNQFNLNPYFVTGFSFFNRRELF